MWKQDGDAHLRRYLNAHPNIASDIAHDLSNLTLERYLDIRTDGDREAIAQTYKGFVLEESAEPLPMFCWLADINKESQKAVFSIRTEDAQGHYEGVGFLTTDQDLIVTMTKMFKYYEGLPNAINKTAPTAF